MKFIIKMSSCDYCKTIFQHKYSLKTHLATNKACLKIRGVEMNNQWQCSACSIILSFKSQLLAHQEICKEFIKKEYDDKIDKLRNEIRLLEEQLNDEKIHFENSLNDQKIHYENRLNDQKIHYETHISLKDERYESLVQSLLERVK
jgi:hypothetical protein